MTSEGGLCVVACAHASAGSSCCGVRFGFGAAIGRAAAGGGGRGAGMPRRHRRNIHGILSAGLGVLGWTWAKRLGLRGNGRKRRENTRIWAKAPGLRPGLGLRHLDLAQNTCNTTRQGASERGGAAQTKDPEPGSPRRSPAGLLASLARRCAPVRLGRPLLVRVMVPVMAHQVF